MRKQNKKDSSKIPLLVLLLFFFISSLCLAFLLNKTSKELKLLTSDLAQKSKLAASLEANLENCGSDLSTCKARFKRKVDIRKTDSGGYALFVKDKPFIMKGIGYSPTPIGKGYDHDFFADPNEPWKVDGKLMQEAGINCVRIYSAGKDLVQVAQFIRDMYENYGIYTIVSDWLGLWDYPRANYADKTFQEETKKRVLKIVSALKNEKGLLMWILGNENNYTFSGRIGFWTSPEIEALGSLREKQEMRAKIYYSFVDEVAREIKKIDKVHPVALGNGEEQFLNVASRVASNVDLLAIIVYRGKTFGNIFNAVKRSFDKPIVLSEFGSDSYNAYKNEPAQEEQSEFLLSQWNEIYENNTFSGNLSGNVLGGFAFEWNDEWWKHNEGYTSDWSVHNTEAGWSQGSYFFDNRAKNTLNMNEEWFGIVSLSEEIADGINKRIPKKSYFTLKELFLNLRIKP